MDPLDILVERESQAELLEVINEIAKELPQDYHNGYLTTNAL
jgi:hypothetical protein